MERAADAWEHNQFKDVVVRVANVEMWVFFETLLILVDLFGSSVITKPLGSISNNSLHCLQTCYPCLFRELIIPVLCAFSVHKIMFLWSGRILLLFNMYVRCRSRCHICLPFDSLTSKPWTTPTMNYSLRRKITKHCAILSIRSTTLITALLQSVLKPTSS